MREREPALRTTEARVSGALSELSTLLDGVIPNCPRFHQRAEGSRVCEHQGDALEVTVIGKVCETLKLET